MSLSSCANLIKSFSNKNTFAAKSFFFMYKPREITALVNFLRRQINEDSLADIISPTKCSVKWIILSSKMYLVSIVKIQV